MAEISGDLIYEVLKSLQNDNSQIKGELRDIKLELNAIRGHLISVQQDVHNIYGENFLRVAQATWPLPDA